VTLTSENPADAPAIDTLLDHCFGPGRFAKTAYRFREGVDPVEGLSLVAREGRDICGTIRFWPILLGQSRGLLLGPLAVDPARQGQGIGIGLMMMGLTRARSAGFPWVMLVGDEPYYARVGFRRAPAGQFLLPGPVDPARLLIRELEPGSLSSLAGAVRPARVAPSAAFAIPGQAQKAGDEKERKGGRKKRAL
jgi:predicted N-acetyltransferase YhbS